MTDVSMVAPDLLLSFSSASMIDDATIVRCVGLLALLVHGDRDDHPLHIDCIAIVLYRSVERANSNRHHVQALSPMRR